MDTKRCANCHKLARADAETCSRCGHFFTPRPKGINRVVMLTDGIESMGRSVAEGDHQGRSYMLKSSPEETCRGRAVSPRDYEPGGRSVSVAMSMHKCSVPPASPHRVGHYSGFHPEDQPYDR